LHKKLHLSLLVHRTLLELVVAVTVLATVVDEVLLVFTELFGEYLVGLHRFFDVQYNLLKDQNGDQEHGCGTETAGIKCIGKETSVTVERSKDEGLGDHTVLVVVHKLVVLHFDNLLCGLLKSASQFDCGDRIYEVPEPDPEHFEQGRLVVLLVGDVRRIFLPLDSPVVSEVLPSGLRECILVEEFHVNPPGENGQRSEAEDQEQVAKEVTCRIWMDHALSFLS